MAKYLTTMRVKLSASQRVMAGEVLDLTPEAAAPLLAVGAVQAQVEDKAEAKADPKPKARAKAEPRPS